MCLLVNLNTLQAPNRVFGFKQNSYSMVNMINMVNIPSLFHVLHHFCIWYPVSILSSDQIPSETLMGEKE